jgi:hypothetical protein
VSRLAVALFVLLLSAAGSARAADTYLLVISGIGGEPYYSDLFQRWSTSMVEVAVVHAGIAPEQVIRLSENPRPAAGLSSKQNILRAIGELGDITAVGDVVMVLLIGHGSARGRDALFNIPGPDLSAAELAGALEPLSERTLVVVNTTAASAPFLEAVAAPGRVVITATAAAGENQHTRFAGWFVTAFATAAADSNKDHSVSLLEAFDYARRAVARDYEREGGLLTEHAQIDDNGDGVGTRVPTADGADGAVAATLHLGAVPSATSPKPSLDQERLALQIEARELVDRIEALKRRKRTLELSLYEHQLEALLVPLARNRRVFRTGSPP